MNTIWLLLLTAVVHAQQEPLSFEQLADSMAVHPKPVVIKIVTSWCPYCRLQDRQISASADVQQVLRNDCYFLVLDAEQHTPVQFNDTTYTFYSNGSANGIHLLALKLVGNKPAYPAWVVLDEKYAVKGTYAGMLKSRELLRFLLLYLHEQDS